MAVKGLINIDIFITTDIFMYIYLTGILCGFSEYYYVMYSVEPP
jgi:hypothetical protein